MGFDVDYPEQPSYGEATTESIQAQIDAMPKILANLGTERELREGYQDLETDLLTRMLLGEVTRFDEEGRAQTGTRRVAVNPEALGGYEMRKVAGNRWGLYKDGQYTGQQSANPAVLSQYVDEPYRGAFQQQLVEGTEFTEEPVYTEGEVGAIASRSGGILDLYGGNTQVRQFSQAKYQENLDAGMSEEEARDAATTWGTAGFDPDTGEFKGLVPMMQEAQAYITSQQRESDVSDVEAFGQRATEAIRSQGNTQEVLDDIARQVSSNEAAVDPLRKQLLTRANELANAQLSDKEKYDLGQLLDARRAGTGRSLRETGAERDYVQGIMEADWNRGMQGALAGGQLMAGESAMQTNLLGQQMTRLGAEQATSADPFMAILGRPSQSAPGAQSLLSTGAGLMSESGSMINPESGLSYISNEYTNKANVAAAEASGKGQMFSGLFSGLGSLGSGMDWWKFGKDKGTG